MVAKKRKSKRQTLQQKFKIIKRTKEHHKRLKKGRLTNHSSGKSKDDNSIPNAWPYKEEVRKLGHLCLHHTSLHFRFRKLIVFIYCLQLLKEIQNAKDKMEELKLRQKEKRKEELVTTIVLRLNFLVVVTM